MLSLTDLKPGIAFKVDNQPFLVLSSEHTKLGRGGAIMRTKIKNLLNGSIIDRTFKGSDTFQEIDLSRQKSQYLYKENQDYYFMDSQNYEQFFLSKEQLKNKVDFLKEGLNLDILFYQGKPIDIHLPVKVAYKVTYTEPGFKGNTQSATTKGATIETGIQIQVPLFVGIGDDIIVDTRTGEYVERT